MDFSGTVVTVNAERTEVIDYTWPIDIGSIIIIGGRRRPEVDKWGFLLPLTAEVWAAILPAFLGVVSVMLLLSCCLPSVEAWERRLLSDMFSCVRVILQQGESLLEFSQYQRVMHYHQTESPLCILKSLYQKWEAQRS